MIATANAVELAERKARARALVFLVFATVIVAVLVADVTVLRADFAHGLWVGVTTGAAISLLPLGRWLKPGSTVAGLLDDEAVREHRRAATSTGFWAGLAVAVVLSFVTGDGARLAPLGIAIASPFDVARLIATAALATALVSFATLELRAARG